MSAQATPRVARSYDVLALLGQGGFGRVYLAQMNMEGDFHRQVAIKVLRADLGDDDEISRRHRDESRVLACLQHRTIVQVLALSRLSGAWSIVMEYVEGPDLQLVLRAGRLPLRVALALGAEVLAGLACAHEAVDLHGNALSILHRDIKPSNLIVTVHGDLKIVDFGIARSALPGREGETRSLSFGTPEYMAPERLMFVSLSASDVYAVGAVLYECVSGSRLGVTEPVRARHEGRVAAALASLPAEVDAETRALLTELLAFDPQDRPTAREASMRCEQLAARAEGPSLRSWAARAIPEIDARRVRPVLDAASATTLYEDASLPTPVEGLTLIDPGVKREDARDRVGRLVGLVSVGLCCAVVVVGGVGLGLWSSVHAGRSPVVAAAVAPLAPITRVEPEPVVPAPSPAPSPTASGLPAVLSPPAPGPSAPPKPAPTAKRATPASAAPSAPNAPSLGEVRVEGDAEEVQLVPVGGGAGVAPGRVPAGIYEVRATFPGDAPMGVGRVSVASGETVRLSCIAQFRACRRVG